MTNLINPVAAAVQRNSYTAVAGFIQSVFFVLLALLMLLTGWGSLLTFLILRGASNVAINLGFTIWFYYRRPEIKPYITTDLRGSRGLVSLGFRFFIIQIAMLILFSTDQFLIVKLLGPEQVPQYDVTFKFFNLFVTVHLMLAAPLWSAYTEAFQKGELGWIRHTIRSQIKIVALLAMASAALIPMARPIIALWTGDRVDLANGLVGLMSLFAVLTIWNNAFGALLNGVGHLRPQIIVATIGAVLNIPLSIFFARTLAFGVNGILLATILCIALQSVILSWAVFNILRHRRAPQQGWQGGWEMSEYPERAVMIAYLEDAPADTGTAARGLSKAVIPLLRCIDGDILRYLVNQTHSRVPARNMPAFVREKLNEMPEAGVLARNAWKLAPLVSAASEAAVPGSPRTLAALGTPR